MSLDVYLSGEPKEINCVCSACNHLHTRMDSEGFYSRNITHNLTEMADEAGIYKHLWRPDEIGIKKAAQLIEPLAKGLADLKARPEHFAKFNPHNGWGDYAGLVDFVTEYLAACREYPQANVSVSR